MIKHSNFKCANKNKNKKKWKKGKKNPEENYVFI